MVRANRRQRRLSNSKASRSRSRRKSSSINHSHSTRMNVFGSLIIILAGFVAVGGLALQSSTYTETSQTNLVGQVGALRTTSTLQMTCFNNCMSSCDSSNYDVEVNDIHLLSTCIDLTVGTCKDICNIDGL